MAGRTDHDQADTLKLKSSYLNKSKYAGCQVCSSSGCRQNSGTNMTTYVVVARTVLRLGSSQTLARQYLKPASCITATMFCQEVVWLKDTGSTLCVTNYIGRISQTPSTLQFEIAAHVRRNLTTGRNKDS